tara:strand:- start:182 stop:496 length:315 start_codon:yes stop_codon:yes gene_type:complete
MKNYCITCILFFITFLSYSQTFDQKIEDLINENLDETIELRHWFHQNAELSNREFKTAARIAEELKKIGYEPLTGIAKTGVVAILNLENLDPLLDLEQILMLCP